MKIFFDTNVYVAEALLGEAAEEMVAATERASWRISDRQHDAIDNPAKALLSSSNDRTSVFRRIFPPAGYNYSSGKMGGAAKYHAARVHTEPAQAPKIRQEAIQWQARGPLTGSHSSRRRFAA
jgi:hypothetical protein